MPVFNGSERIPNLSLANFDKIRITVKNAYRLNFPAVENYNTFKRALAGSDLFNQGRGSQSSKFTVSRQTLNRQRRWLFGGGLRFKTNNSNRSYTGSLDLELNPSRFINHLIHSAGMPESPEHLQGLLQSFLIDARPHEALESCLDLPNTACALDGADNLIPHRPYRFMQPAMAIFRPYLEKALAFIRQEIENALSHAVSSPTDALEAPLEGFELACSEIYWEYAVTNAPAFVNGAKGFVMPLFREARATEYLPDATEDDARPAVSWAVDRNSPVLRLNRGSNGADFTIYAKTQGRVRFEAGYQGNIKRLIGVRTNTQSLEGLLQLLDQVTEHACIQMQRLVNNLPDLDYTERCTFQEFLEFLSALSAACHDAGIPKSLEHVLSLLASNGGIEVSLGSPEHNACKKLVKHSILFARDAIRNLPGFKRYVLHSMYETALRKMIENI